MIIAERKPFEAIVASVGAAERILLAGCGGCVSVCETGGENEVAVLAIQLRMALELQGRAVDVTEITVQRQCEPEFVDELAAAVKVQQVIVTLGCGAGTQLVAQRLEPLRVVPAVDTRFIGATVQPGEWAESCQACGQCVLDLTGGVCPIARCSKSLLNGPCGGSSDGSCEIDADLPCAWELIYRRLLAQNREAELERVIGPKDWRSARDGGPRRLRRGGKQS